MATPLMPKATAVWLVDNTTLSFTQISEFCGLHDLEVQAIADGEVAIGMVGRDPIANGELTKEEIARCEADPAAHLRLQVHNRPQPVTRAGGPRYTPVAKRQDRPDAIAWLLKNHPELQDSQIAKLIGSTKSTIQAIRDRTHWNSANIKQRDPITLGLCSLRDLNAAVEKARQKAAREASAKKRAQALAGQDSSTVPTAELEPLESAPQDPLDEADEVDPAQADQPDLADAEQPDIDATPDVANDDQPDTDEQPR
ncbi:MAG: DUF1013 domain-containing protein [Alphaproteobacteria bacterium]|nr:DUF1013 domain-containing protein [Alphaproteobacteria bacterium]MCW5743119.1 DUF1013 domain-containing protein [Alphaproteobacteria bacterium]